MCHQILKNHSNTERSHELRNVSSYNYKNDIALIRLESSAYDSPTAQSICLPEPRNFTNQIGIVTGWGTIYYGGPHSETLMEVLVPIWKQADCKKAYTQPIEVCSLNAYHTIIVKILVMRLSPIQSRILIYVQE